MNKSLKKTITILLVIGGSIFVLLFDLKLALDWIDHELDPKYDEDGKIIYQDGRKTIKSFGKRKQFAVEKGFWIEDDGKKIRTWELFDIDKNNCIDEIRYFTRSSSSPCVYSLGKKGYTRLNYETGEIIQSRNINDFQGDDKTVFEKLAITKSEAEDDQEKFEVSWEWIFS